MRSSGSSTMARVLSFLACLRKRITSIEFETTQLDGGPLVSWVKVDPQSREQHFADLALKPIRVHG